MLKLVVECELWGSGVDCGCVRMIHFKVNLVTQAPGQILATGTFERCRRCPRQTNEQ